MSLLSPIDAAAPSQRALPPSRTVPLIRAMRVVIGLTIPLLIAVWSLLLIAWLTLHWAILPHIQQWRGPIETRVSQALGVPLRIGHIEVRTGSWVPAFELRDVVLLDASQRPVLRLPRVAAALSARSLLAFELRFKQLLIDGAELDVRRDAQGRIFVAGLDFSGPDAGGQHGDQRAAADWFFAQPEFVIRGGSLRWTDEQRQAPPLALTNVQLVIRNGLRDHDLRLDATPPPAWGDSFSVLGRFTQPLLARRGDVQQWSGSAYVNLPRADLRELRRHVSLPFELIEGDGALRGWFDVKGGEPTAATIDLALRAVALRLASDIDVLEVEQLEGRLVAERRDDGVALDLQRFGFVTGDGLRWPQGDIGLRWQQRAGQPASGGAFQAQHLDLGLMAQIASKLPLGQALRDLLATLNPRGAVSDLAASWDGALDAPRHYHAKGLLTGLSLDALASDDPAGIGRPGLRNASLQLDATEAGGNAQLAVDAGAIDLPGVFDEALLPLDRLQAQLLWTIEPAAGRPPKLTVQVSEARFANPDAHGELSATWTTGPGQGVGREGRYPGQLRLDSRLVDAAAIRTARYIPRGIPLGVRDYLARAVRGGKLATADFHVNGRLWDFPFAHARASKDGEFRITAQLADVAFAYVPDAPASGAEPAYASPWPALENVNGELVIDRNSLDIRDARTRLGGVDWHGVQAGIKSLDAPVLVLDGLGRGPLTEMLHFVDTTPIGGWMGRGLAQATASGAASIALKLEVPIEHAEATRVKGSLALAGNDLRISADSPLLAEAGGRVDFSDQGFAVVGGSAKVFGGPLSFDGGSQADGSLRFKGEGTASAEGLRHAADLPDLARVATVLSGQAGYRVNLALVHGQTELDLTSNLVGTAIDLPAPLNKPVDAPLALRYRATLVPESLASGQRPRDQLRFELGGAVQAQYQRDLSGPVPQVLRGGIGVMEPAPEPAAGVAANINLPSLDVDAWNGALAKLFTASDEPHAGGGYNPDTIALRVRSLRLGARRLDNLIAGASQVGGLWRANLDADQLGGYVEYRPASMGASSGAAGGTDSGRVYARLARLSLPKGDDDSVETLLDQAPASMPGLDVVVDDFELRGRRLGRLEVEAANRRNGEGREALREWRLAKLKLSMPEAELNATGQWAAVGGPAGGGVAGPRHTTLDFQLALQDSGSLLDRLGTPRAIRGGRGQLAGQVSWRGSPFAFDVPSLAGQVHIAIDSGQFLKADPGAARLLGVLSLQSLPRRLSLDFRDLFQEGFAFDNITGDVAIALGEAETHNLRMRGVQAVVLMDGRADIAAEQQDLRVWVVPEINAGTASLAYAVINPVIGFGTFLAQMVLGKQLAEAGTREFHVHGPWADPKVDTVERKFGDDVPSFDVPLSSPLGAASAPNVAR